MKLLHLGPLSKRNYGHSSFVVVAPRLWNKLPLVIREAKSVTIFRQKIKTHLFTDFLHLNLSIHRPSYNELLLQLLTPPPPPTEYRFPTASLSLNIVERYWRYESHYIIILVYYIIVDYIIVNVFHNLYLGLGVLSK